jgi:hypothetical protein
VRVVDLQVVAIKNFFVLRAIYQSTWMKIQAVGN